jgi:hypothetical protein
MHQGGVYRPYRTSYRGSTAADEGASRQVRTAQEIPPDDALDRHPCEGGFTTTFTGNRRFLAAIVAVACTAVPAAASADSLPSTDRSDAARSGAAGSPSTDRSDAA